jgi:penicillin amidase
LVRRGWPDINGTFQAPGLQSSVQIVRDKWGVPHIYAENDHDLFFAQGYAHAQDRLWQMEMDRNASKGTLAGIVGKGALVTDRFVRTIGLARTAEQTWNNLDADTQALLEAYAAGVNAYIDTHHDHYPVEFVIMGVNPEPWQPIDSLAIANLMALQLSHNYRLELLRAQVIAQVGQEGAQDLFTPYAQGTPVIVPPEAGNYSWLRHGRFEALDAMDDLVGDPTPGWGSNNWVVSGSRTATGKPILENDTHLGLQMPSFWYENDLHGGRFNVTGFSLPGVPFVIIGHNQNIAWGETTLGQDVQDYYLEKVDDPAQPTQYEYQGQWYPIEVEHESIPVKGGQPVPFDILFTRHGPLMTEVMSSWLGVTNTQPLALRWSIYDGNQLPRAAKQLNLAANWDEFRTALSYWDSPGVNMVYADTAGNIGYQATGRTPIRAPQHQGLVPVPGWTGDFEWQSYIPYDQMPRSFNPPAGFIATANNRVTTADYPYFLAYDWFPGYRAQRISDLLAANDQVTIADIQAIAAQTYSLPAEALRPYLLSAVQPANEQETQALDLVKNWDLYFERDRAGATIYERWYIFLVENTISDELGPTLTDKYLAGRYERHGNQHVPMLVNIMPEADNHWFDDVTTPQRETRDDLIRRSFSQAVQWLSENEGKDPQGWQWGRLHTVQFPHITFGSSKPLNVLFNSQTVALPGDHFSVNAASFRWTDPFAVIHAVSQRMIIDLGNLDNSLSIHTTGQNEQLGHPHREDFIPLWANLQFHPMLSERSKVDQYVEGTLELTP